MDRVTFRIPRDQIDDIDTLVDNGEFSNRSEAFRTAVRGLLKEYGRNAGRPLMGRRP